jgi:hypothetical protein
MNNVVNLNAVKVNAQAKKLLLEVTQLLDKLGYNNRVVSYTMIVIAAQAAVEEGVSEEAFLNGCRDVYKAQELDE